ncbi:hypothetical protein NWE60_06310 [Mycoplasmopsis felis]|nr:hypothetical protein [Mycoplasmopsis felis]WAM00981.1 hypothetical protein NWE60_06310 [Mycoplasmopsis felis]
MEQRKYQLISLWLYQFNVPTRKPKYEPIATPIKVWNVAIIIASLIAFHAPTQDWVHISIPDLEVPKKVFKFNWGLLCNASL